MNDTIVNAIGRRLVVTIWYSPGVRVIEPHAIGIGSDGQFLLRAYQVEGASESGESRNWKLFRLDRMQNASCTGETFIGPRPDYKQNDRAMTRGIIAQL